MFGTQTSDSCCSRAMRSEECRSWIHPVPGRSARAEAWCWRPVAFLTTRGFARSFFLVERDVFPPSAPETTGDGLHVAMAGGASLNTRATNAAYWVPASLFRRADGSQGVFPHTVTDRAKPGVIAVNSSGRRFVNEAVSYHEFVLAMLREGNDATHRSFYLVCDRRFLWTYGLGRIKPFAWSIKPYVERWRIVRGAEPRCAR